ELDLSNRTNISVQELINAQQCTSEELSRSWTTIKRMQTKTQMITLHENPLFLRPLQPLQSLSKSNLHLIYGSQTYLKKITSTALATTHACKIRYFIAFSWSDLDIISTEGELRLGGRTE
ncbi:hypothetical protein M758_5G196200, partial [Ceratodon purpureus]